MSDIKWIKIVTDIFDDEKMLLIETLPEADSIIVIWFKLLCLAGKQNNSGVFTLNGKIPYTDKMLATIFRRKETTVKLALETFENFGMIEIINNTITIPNWSKHQDFSKIERNKEYMREYMKQYREKQKLLAGGNKVSECGLNINDWKYVLDTFNYTCAYCENKSELEQDHIVPVNKNGRYELGNIVPACRRCNASKNNKNMIEWYKMQDFYDKNKLKKIEDYMCKFNVNINVKDLRKTNVNSLDKIREDKNRIDKNNKKTPTLEEIQNYITEKQLKVDGKQFYDYFTEGNWIDSKGNKVKNWKQKLLTWNKYGTNIQKEKQTNYNNYQQRNYEDLNKFYVN